ncbi:hypothetical protein PENTCL1PPCAC_15734, partial [Pristionchus entomophagus]
IAGISFSLSISNINNASISSVYGQLFETLHALGLLVVVGVLICSQPAWKSKIATRFGIRKSTSVEVPTIVPDAFQVTRSYFSDLARTWDV